VKLTMKWQRFRCTGPASRYPGLSGWVRVGPPVDDAANGVPAYDAETGLRANPEPTYLTNMIEPGTGDPLWIPARKVELLPEFAADVPLIEFDAALAEWRGAGEVRH
jgi:hypothetical protein